VLPPPSASPTSSGNQNKSGPTSSPLLFFVALGFGVVFTNLWIIVGVKYCFRYNRVRNARLAGQDIDAVDLQPVHPRRRRREKKLMSMEEVNERFPLTKYKQWKAARENQGLPSSGGIQSTPQSRAASIKDVERTVSPGADTDSADKGPITVLSLTRDDHTPATSASKEQETPAQVESKKARQSITVDEKVDDKELARVRSGENYQPGKETSADSHDDSDDEDDPIRTAAAPELLAEPGDTCAICLDTLEHDDDVRGLTCGHAFHASCLDPWLTSRRACCPLCKADYYTPKPTPEGETTEPAIPGRQTAGTRNLAVPQATLPRGNIILRSRTIFFPPSRPPPAANTRATPAPATSRWEFPWSREVRQQMRQPPRQASIGRSPADPRPATYVAPMPRPSWRERLPAVPNPFARSTTTTNTPSAETQQPTPGQLEAGNR